MEKSEITYLIIAATVILVLLSIFIIALLWNYYKRNTSYRNKLLYIEHQKQQELLQTQLEIQEQTLKTISQEIHDNVGQVLSLAKLNLNTVGTISDMQVQSKIESTKDLVSKAINDLRDLSRSLHGEKIGEIGLQEAVANELKILQNTGQFETGMNVTGQVFKLDPQKEMVLFRIVQEALHNAVKHANAKHLKVLMNYNAAVFTLTISDDGIGFVPEQLHASKTGIGLKSMQNRAALIGGIYSIHSSNNNGTSISVEIPYIKL
jgi:two-component system NarL family sensor kinase